MDPFYQCTKLVEALFTNEQLRQRYRSGSLIHQLCYEQAYCSTQTCMERLQEICIDVAGVDSESSVNSSSSPWVDECGLTPFHVLAMSVRPNSYLFQSLIQKRPSRELLYSRDRWGKTPLQYLSKSHSKVANALIQMILQNSIVPRIPWLGLSEWRRELWMAIESLSDDDSAKGYQICRLEHRWAILERLEVTSLLELAIWKQSLQNYLDCQSGKHGSMLDAEEQNRLRHGCRFSCRSEIVIPLVLSWMDPVEAIQGIDTY